MNAFYSVLTKSEIAPEQKFYHVFSFNYTIDKIKIEKVSNKIQLLYGFVTFPFFISVLWLEVFINRNESKTEPSA